MEGGREYLCVSNDATAEEPGCDEWPVVVGPVIVEFSFCDVGVAADGDGDADEGFG